MELRVLRGLRIAVVGVFILSLLAGIMLPLYTDEVGWRFNSRAAFDGVDKLYSDLCGANTLAAPPFFIMPVRHYSAFFNTLFPDPLYVRLSGILYALVWTGMLLVLIRRIAAGAHNRLVLPIIAFGLMGLGTMPLLLVWSRPEQPILIVTIGALLIAWSDWREPGREAGPRQAWLRSLAIAACAIVAVSYHLKGAFLAPLFLACVFFASRGRAAIAPRLTAAALVTVTTLWGLRYWVNRLACPDDPILSVTVARQSVGTEILKADNAAELIAALSRLLGNMTPWGYFGIVVPRPAPMSQWVLPWQISADSTLYWYLAIVALWGIAGIALVAWAGSSTFTAIRTRRFDRGVVVTIALVMAVLGWSSTQLSRNVYDASFVLPIMMLAAVIALATHGGEGRTRLLTDILVFPLALAAIASPFGIAAIYGPSFVRASGERGYVTGQPYSQSVFHYDSTRRDILGAAKLCGFDDFRRTRALMIDDVTYFTTMQSPLPQHFIGVVGGAKGSITDPVAYLRSRGSSGVIVSCAKLPGDLRKRAKQQGGICCLAAPGW